MIARPIAHGVAVLVNLAATSARVCSSHGYTLASDSLSQSIAAGLATIAIKAIRALSILSLRRAPPRRTVKHLLQRV